MSGPYDPDHFAERCPRCPKSGCVCGDYAQSKEDFDQMMAERKRQLKNRFVNDPEERRRVREFNAKAQAAWRAKKAAPLPTWKTADGRRILVRDMDDVHLGNALRYLERKADEWGQPHPSTPVYKALVTEAQRRRLKWNPRGRFCTFRVRFTEGDYETCNAQAVTLQASEAGLDGWVGRCQEHRQDKHAYEERECDGCFRTDREFVVEADDMLFCGECATAPDGPFSAFLAVLVLILTLGRVRL